MAPPIDSEPESGTSASRPTWGRSFVNAGYVMVSVGVGIGIGYWAADWALRWMPSVVRNILLLWTLGFVCLALGARWLGAPRGRVLSLGVLAGLAAIGIGASSIMTRTTPLTAMSEAEFRYSHTMDAGYFRDLDRTLRRLVALLEAEGHLFQPGAERSLTPDDERLLLDAWSGYLDTALALDRVRRFHEDFYGFDLSRMERTRHVRSFLLSFAAELSLYENTARIIDLFENNPNVVRFLNVARPGRSIEQDSVALVREELAGLTDFSRVAAGRRYLTYLAEVHQGRVDAVSEGIDWLWQDCERYASVVAGRGSRERVAMSAASDFAPILRQLKHFSFPVQKGIAEWMGDVRVKRVGKYLITAEQAGVMQGRLSPGDVLLSRKNWYLSNIGLPGFWPHAILYVGTNDQIAATFDDDPAVLEWVQEQTDRTLSFTEYLAERHAVPWRRRGEAGAQSLQQGELVVIEAVSEGVIQNTLYGASGDFIVGLRPRVSPVAKARAIDRAFSYLERPYDFDFDFATDHALVCTEVVWRSYRSQGDVPGLELSPVPVAGRMTLPANEIARTFRDELELPEAKFDFVYYLEGRESDLAAVPASVDAFLETPERPKWDFGGR